MNALGRHGGCMAELSDAMRKAVGFHNVLVHECVEVSDAIVESRLSDLPVRLTAEQDALIRCAAEVEGTDLTNFTVTATLAHARNVLADRRRFVFDDAAWSKFMAALDRPVSHKPRLKALLAEESIFDAAE